jgi:2-dehydro-3-deoxyphosphogalactonate aldolase
MLTLERYPMPLIAILRGLTAAEAGTVGPVLFEAGFRLLEVPLNRPGALEAISVLSSIAPDHALIGGGTVLTLGDVDAVRSAGGRFMVAPNCEPDLIRYARQNDMMALPGVATPTEAFRALEAGAHGLKLFPAEMMPPPVVAALRSVLPRHVCLLPVGGINPDNMAAYVAAGADGFGIGSQLYRPGMDLHAIRQAAHAFASVRSALLQKM